jgi:hypothetical protein
LPALFTTLTQPQESPNIIDGQSAWFEVNAPHGMTFNLMANCQRRAVPHRSFAWRATVSIAAGLCAFALMFLPAGASTIPSPLWGEGQCFKQWSLCYPDTHPEPH